jgi:hypothetical protein
MTILLILAVISQVLATVAGRLCAKILHLRVGAPAWIRHDAALPFWLRETT